MTDQELFDRCARHLLTQRAKSFDDHDEVCMYHALAAQAPDGGNMLRRQLFKSYGRRNGWGRQSLLDLLDAAGELASHVDGWLGEERRRA